MIIEQRAGIFMPRTSAMSEPCPKTKPSVHPAAAPIVAKVRWLMATLRLPS
jgi:hypothetical protein